MKSDWWKKKGRWVWVDMKGRFGFDRVDAIVREIIPGMGAAGTTFFQQLPSFHVEVIDGYHKGHWLVQILHQSSKNYGFWDDVRVLGFWDTVWDRICSKTPPGTKCKGCKARWFCKEELP